MSKIRAAYVEAITPVTSNVLVVKIGDSHADPSLIVDGETYNFFRRAPGDNNHVYIRTAPANLGLPDIESINEVCENNEKEANIKVKRVISHALTRHFNDKAFHINEFGCGKFPLSASFTKDNTPSFYGVEVDKTILSTLQKQGIQAGNWDQAMRNPDNVPKGKPTIAASIYALHFMINNKLPKRINHLTSEEGGFFVANLYKNPAEIEDGIQQDKLKEVLDRHHMAYLTIPDPDTSSNEYWIISRAGNVSDMHTFANVLQSSILLNRPKKKPELVKAAPG